MFSAELHVLKRVARYSQINTVALVFATNDFFEIILNWACHALSVGVRWFVLVACDTVLYKRLRASEFSKHALLLPRVRDGNVTLTKLNVIGERQTFGLSVLERGYSVVHSDADALWIKDPTSLFAGGDVVAERIWGKPISVVKQWGAAICTGFYYLRSTPAVIGIARTVQREVAAKRARQPGWQASDQYYINVVLKRMGVRWSTTKKMEDAQSMATRFTDNASHVGVVTTPHGPLRLVLLAHNAVPRACPMLSADETAKLQSGGKLKGKARYWRMLLISASVLHCFPPEKARASSEKRSIFMGIRRKRTMGRT